MIDGNGEVVVVARDWEGIDLVLECTRDLWYPRVFVGILVAFYCHPALVSYVRVYSPPNFPVLPPTFFAVLFVLPITCRWNLE